MLCLSCNTNEAVKHEYLGYIACQSCRDRQAKFDKPKETVEMTTEEIRSARVEHEADIVQPFREGVVNKRYLDLYGSERIQATPQEIKQAKYVFSENKYYKEGDH